MDLNTFYNIMVNVVGLVCAIIAYFLNHYIHKVDKINDSMTENLERMKQIMDSMNTRLLANENKLEVISKIVDNQTDIIKHLDSYIKQNEYIMRFISEQLENIIHKNFKN